MRSNRWPLIGRSRECSLLADTLKRPGLSLVIAGAAGVGRTRMAHEALRLAEARGRRTRWAVATAAAAQVPLGALAHLLPAVEPESNPLALLQRAARSLAGDDVDEPMVLGVDDAHLLDPLSVTVLHQLALSSTVTLVLTVRTDRVVPDPAGQLWKDGLAARVELDPLGRADVNRLVARALGGEVATRTRERLSQLSRGSPLYLRELLEDGLRTGRLRTARDLWRWEGPMVPSGRLAEIVLGHVGGLSLPEQQVLEDLALAGRLTVRELVELGDAEVVAALERRGLLAVEHGHDQPAYTVHPLYAEVLGNRAPGAARWRLADGLAGTPPSAEEWRRRAVLLDVGGPGPSSRELGESAQRAHESLDHHLAERLAREAIQAGAGMDAHLALIEATFWQGRAEEGERLAATAESAARTEDDGARLAATRAVVLFCGLGRAAAATAVLDAAAGSLHTDEPRAILGATRAVLSLLGGDPQRAVLEGTRVLDSVAEGDAARPLAAAAVAAGLAVTGRAARALAVAGEGFRALETLRRVVQPVFARVALAQAEIMALHAAGELRELESRADELHRRNLAVPEWGGDAVTCLHRGWSLLAGGGPRPALRWLNDALAGFERVDPVGLGPVCRSLWSMAIALTGDAAAAREVLADATSSTHPAIRLFDPQARQAESWVVAAENRREDAGALAMEGARLAAAQGQWVTEAVLLNDAARFGAGVEVLGRLQELAAELDSPLVDLIAARAAAGVAGSAERLEAVGRQFQASGALLYGADAAAQAAVVYERHGDRRSAAAAAARATALAQEGGAAEPAVVDVSPPVLTEREEQVAQLAVRGMSNLAIADQLVLSVRTVEAHLARVYGKLGISRRSELAAVLTLPRPRSGRQSPLGLPA